MKKIIIYIVVAIGLILLMVFLIAFIQSLRSTLLPKRFCDEPVNCTKCENGFKYCHYYVESDNSTLKESNDTIRCKCP